LIVADTNVVLYATVPAPNSAVAEAVLRRDRDWVAPPIWTVEYVNALLGYRRRSLMSSQQAKSALGQALSLVATRSGARPEELLVLAEGCRCSAYDLEFVALARALGVPLVTNDRQVLEAFPGAAVAPDAFAASS
jgi:predicted nucleic acid-binding protein